LFLGLSNTTKSGYKLMCSRDFFLHGEFWNAISLWPNRFAFYKAFLVERKTKENEELKESKRKIHKIGGINSWIHKSFEVFFVGTF